jgi:hypothetical protein
MTKNNNIPQLPFDILGYINDIKEQEEKLDKIEKQQRKNYKFVINELETNFNNVFERNFDIVECDDSEYRSFVSIIDYLNLRKEKFEYESFEEFHYLQQLESEVKEFYNQVIKQINKEKYYKSYNKECLMGYFEKTPYCPEGELFDKYGKRCIKEYEENFEYYFFMKDNLK